MTHEQREIHRKKRAIEYAEKIGNVRKACRCLKTVDIGMDNTCLAGCRYRYVVTSHASAVKNFRRHDPSKPMLR
jgi:hypothetical protein